MWKIIKNSNLFLTYTEEYQIYITDFVTIWYSYLSKTTFLRYLKESNILLEMSDDSLIQKGQQVLSRPGDIKNYDQKLENKMLTVSMTMLFGYPFKVTLKLFEGSKELFFLKVTQPLVKTIGELKSNQAELCELLNKKDSEIEEYKTMGGEIAIKFLKTKPFNEEALLSKYQMYQEYFGNSNDTVHKLLSVKLDVPEDVTNIKQEIVESVKTEPQVIKMEPDSQTEAQNVAILQDHEVKIESRSPIKTESQSSIPNSKKRMKKLNL